MDLKNKPKELLELNPYGKVPVLVDGKTVIYESAIINEYLDEKFPEPSLLPKDLGERARTRIWVDFCNSRVHGAGSGIRHGKDPQKSREQLMGHLKRLDQEMKGREYLVGNYSLADITFIPFFTRLERYGITLNGDLPNLKKWVDRLLTRPAVRSTL